jgi:hypothetical protein
MRERIKRSGAAYAAIPNAALRDESISMEARDLDRARVIVIAKIHFFVSMEPIRMYTTGAGSGQAGQTLNPL